MISLLLSATLFMGNNTTLPDLDETENKKIERIEWNGISISLIWKAVVYEEDIMSAVYGPYLQICQNTVCDTLHVDDYPATEYLSPFNYHPLKFKGYDIRKDTLKIDLGYDGMIVHLLKKKEHFL